jgi:hypothetical protein
MDVHNSSDRHHRRPAHAAAVLVAVPVDGAAPEQAIPLLS